MNKKLILLGGGGHCASCIDVIESLKYFEICGILDKTSLINSDVLGYKVLGEDIIALDYIEKGYYFLITVGQIKSSQARESIYKYLTLNQGKLATIIAPSAIVSKYSEIGQGTIIMHLTLVNANVKIGNNCIINNKALIEHDNTIGNHTHISTGAIVNGGCVIGNNVFVGSQSVIVQGITVADNVIIGAGSTVVKSIYTEGTYLGNPAIKI